MPEALELDDEVVVEAKALRNTGAALLKERPKSPGRQRCDQRGRKFRAPVAATRLRPMSHVTGASVVDGKYVYIRGLGDRYSSVQLNGSSLPNADPDKRSVPMDLFPTSLLDNIVTTKSFTPDKPRRLYRRGCQHWHQGVSRQLHPFRLRLDQIQHPKLVQRPSFSPTRAADAIGSGSMTGRAKSPRPWPTAMQKSPM